MFWAKKNLTALEKKTINVICELSKIATARKENFEQMQGPQEIKERELLDTFKLYKKTKTFFGTQVQFDPRCFDWANDSFSALKNTTITLCATFISQFGCAKNNITKIKNQEKMNMSLSVCAIPLKNALVAAIYNANNSKRQLKFCKEYYSALEKNKLLLIKNNKKMDNLIAEIKIFIEQIEQLIYEFQDTIETLNTLLKKFEKQINELKKTQIII